MPLANDAEKLIRKNLQYIRNGRRAKPVIVGALTEVQLARLNEERAQRDFPAMQAEIVFVGKHIYERRIQQDGYSVDDVILQITRGMHESCIFHANPKMNSLVSNAPREDGYGNEVVDEVVLECTVRFPRPELYSVIPRGDQIKPNNRLQQNRGRADAAPIQDSTDPPG